MEWYTSNVLSQRSKSVKRITEQQDKQPLQKKKTKQTLRRNSCCLEATKKSPVQKMSIQHSVCHRFEDAHIGKAKCSASIHLKGTNHQPECSQGSISEGLSPPSATNSEMCPSQRIPLDDPEQRSLKCVQTWPMTLLNSLFPTTTLSISLINQLRLNWKILHKSDGNLPLNIKDPALSGSEFRYLKSTTVAKLTAEGTIQVHFWCRKRSVISYTQLWTPANKQ